MGSIEGTVGIFKKEMGKRPDTFLVIVILPLLCGIFYYRDRWNKVDGKVERFSIDNLLQPPEKYVGDLISTLDWKGDHPH